MTVSPLAIVVSPGILARCKQLHQACGGFGPGPNRAAKLLTVEASHCGYLQMQQQFENVLAPRLQMAY